MDKEYLLKKIKSLKQNIAKHILRTSIFALSASAPAHTSGIGPNQSESNKNLMSETIATAGLSAEDIFIAPEAINVAEESSSSPIYEFTNKVYDKNNNEVKDFANVTKYSLWDCSYKREVGTQRNPVGVVGTFYGSLQFNRFNAENMAIYGLLHPNFKDLASKFFVHRTGFNEAIASFKKSAENYKKAHGDANLVYHVGSTARRKLVQYLNPKFKSLFEKMGLTDTQQLLNLQRAYASEVYCSFDAKNLKKIVSTLEKSNIKPEEVNPAIWGMFLAKHIKGGFNGIAPLLAGKSLKQINSLSFVNSVAAKFPSVFKQNSGKEAWKFAKDHYKEKHSITTIKELSLILEKPEILNSYLKNLALFHDKTLGFEQAQELAQLDPSQSTLKLKKTQTNINPNVEKIKIQPMDVMKIKKSKSR